MKSKVKLSFQIKFAEFLLLILLIVSGIFLGFSSGGFIVNLKSVGFTAISSVEKGLSTVTNGIKNTFGAVQELHNLRKDYEELTKKLENYQQMQRTNADIRKENERLKEQLNFTTSLEEKNYPAQIISREIDNLNAFITIDKGSVNGIKKNMPVIAFQNGELGLVGKIVQVGALTSIVMPVYNTECTISARIQNTRDLGLVTGNGNQDIPLTMSYIKKRVIEELHAGDVIVTSGENNNYMKDIPIGSIAKIDVQDYNSTLLIELNPIIDFARLENVVVVNMKEINEKN